jgi:hypothetical protein
MTWLLNSGAFPLSWGNTTYHRKLIIIIYENNFYTSKQGKFYDYVIIL